MKSETISRLDLYNLVWSEPLSSLSKKYNMTDDELRKVCVQMNIPLPKTGHWQKLQHGKQIQIIELPNDYTGDQEVTLEEKTKILNSKFFKNKLNPN